MLKHATKVLHSEPQTNSMSSRFGHGTWYQLIHDPEGLTRFYGLISAQSIKYHNGLRNWLTGTKFLKYHFGKPCGVFVVKANGEGKELVRV